MEAWELHTEQLVFDTAECGLNNVSPRIGRLTFLGFRDAIISCSILENPFFLNVPEFYMYESYFT